MAKKEISIVLRAKNELQVGLAKAGAQLQAFGTSALNVGKMIAGAFIAAGTAIAGIATKALSAYSEQETAIKSLQASFRAYGENINVNTEAIKLQAQAIMDETGVSDDNLIARAARLRLLGVETTKLDAAMKATVALASAGMEEEAAIAAVAKAHSGNYTALQKVIPALREAKTEQEKQAILSAFLAKGYEIQKDSLNTLSGRWGLLKERVGDVWEEIGAAIAQSPIITEALSYMTTKAEEFATAINNWVAGGGVVNAQAAFQLFFEDLKYQYEVAKLNIKAFWEAFSDTYPVQYIGQVIGSWINSVVENFKFLKDVISAAWEKITNPLAEVKMPDYTMAVEANKEYLKSFLGMNLEQKNSAEKTFQEIEALRIQHNKNNEAILQQHTANLISHQNEQVKNEKIASQARTEIATRTSKSIYDINVLLHNGLAQLNDERIKNEEETTNQLVALNENAAQQIADAAVYANTQWKKVFKGIDGTEESSISVGSGSSFGNVTPGVLGSPAGGGVQAMGFGFTGGRVNPALNLAPISRWFDSFAHGNSGNKILDELRNIRRDNQQLLRYR